MARNDPQIGQQNDPRPEIVASPASKNGMHSKIISGPGIISRAGTFAGLYRNEGREGVKWELGFAFFRGWEMGFCALGLGFMKQKQ